MIDPREPGSPDWWFDRLLKRQMDRLPTLQRLYRYGIGDHDLPEGDQNVREAFQRFQKRARSNYTGLIAESLLERLRITAFRAGGGDEDKDAWNIWRANRLNADFKLVLRSALYMREAYMMVGPPSPARGGMPVITPEDPREMIVELDPLDKRTVIAALKFTADDVKGLWKAALILPDRVYGYTAPLNQDVTQDPYGYAGRSWTRVNDVPNPLKRVSVVRFPNRMDLSGNCFAEFEDVMDIQDRINNTLLDRLVIAKMQAYRQRWITGATFEDEEGNPIEPFKPGVDLVWAVEEGEAKFGEFQQADLRQMLEAVSADVRDLGAISRTPAHYLLGEFINASGDAFSQSETGHVAKATERQDHFGEAAEEVMRMAYAYMGDDRAGSFDLEVVWADPQYRSMAERADAAVKYLAAGVPWRTIMASVLGYSPQEISRMDAERTSDALLAQTLAAPTPALPAGATQAPTRGGDA